MYNDKFKTRSPEETIKIVQDFFKSKNLILKEIYNENNIENCFSFSYFLYYNDLLIQTSNGKGVTKIFARASGHAELYERFCNYYFLKSSSQIFLDEYTKIKNIPYSNSFEKIANFDYIKDYINLHIEKNKYYNFEYQNLNNINDKILIDPTSIQRIITSNGMAAGNSLEEALNQGISELYERYVTWQFYLNKIDKYYIFYKDDIKNQFLKDIVQNIENENFKIFFIDFSYNFNLPVIGCVCTDLLTNSINCIFGSFPVFDIALERCLTELYQGISILGENRFSSVFMPMPNSFVDFRLKDKGNIGMVGSLPTSILQKNNLIHISNENNSIFIDQNKNNFEILEYNKKIAKENDFNIYYRSVSLTSELYAIHLLSNKSQMNYGVNEYINDQTKEIKNIFIDLINQNNNIMTDIVYNNISPKQFIEKYKKFFINYNKLTNEQLKALYFQDQSTIILTGSVYSVLCDLILQEKINIDKINHIKDYDFQKYFKLLYTVVSFKECDQYSDEEIFNILNNLNLSVTLDFIKNSTNLEYAIQECYFKPIKQRYILLQNFIKLL